MNNDKPPRQVIIHFFITENPCLIFPWNKREALLISFPALGKTKKAEPKQKGEKTMSNMLANVVKGVVSGIVVGTAVGVIANRTHKPKSKFRRSACRTLESLSCMLHNMAEMTK